MFCKNCGKEVQDNALFCASCGTATGNAPAPAAPATPVESAPVAPAAPVEAAPAAPVESAPVAPAAPVEVAPAAPVDATPAAPVDATPATPVDPAAPVATDTPINPVPQDAPVTPAPGIPVTSVPGADGQYQPQAPGADGQYQPPAPGMNIPAEPPAKKPVNKVLIIIIIAVLVLALAAAAVFAIPKLFGSKTNPIAATIDGLKSIGEAESFDASIEMVDDYGDDLPQINMSMIIGDSLADSVFHFESLDDEFENYNRVILFDDAIVMGHFYDLDDRDDDWYYDGLAEDLTSALEEAIENELGTSIDIDSFFSEDEADIDDISGDLVDTLNETLEAAGLDIEISSFEGVTNVIENFIYVRCNDKEVLENIISNESRTKKSGNTTYTYDIDGIGFLKEFGNYLNDISKDDKYLKKHDLDERDVNALKFLMNMITPFMGDIEIPHPTISVTLDKKGNLVELEIIPNLEEDSEMYFLLTIENYNNSQIDLDELRDRVENAEFYGNGLGNLNYYFGSGTYDDYDDFDSDLGGWDDYDSDLGDWDDYDDFDWDSYDDLEDWDSLDDSGLFGDEELKF